MDMCLNGNDCHHPFCPEHEVRDLRDKTDWPPLAESDPVFDSWQPRERKKSPKKEREMS